MIPIKSTLKIDGRILTVLPALIDPHVHFRVPGAEHKEDWRAAARACVQSGITTVCEMPNNTPPCTTLERFIAKKEQIDAQLQEVGIPLHYGLYFGADKGHFDEMLKVGQKAVALKIFMGCSTGGLVIDTDEALDDAFRFARDAGLIVAVHAEDEKLLAQKRVEFQGATDPATHSKMRPREAAIKATDKAISLAAKYSVPLYILHMSTKEELELVRQAKQSGLPVYAETTTHHLYLNEYAYEAFGTLVQMNPPLRTPEDQEALWEALRDGTLDTVGTDHAPHTLEEKRAPFGQAPSGIPGVETLLPLMLHAVNQGWITLDRMVELTRTNSEKLFKLPPNQDVVLVDMEQEKEVYDREIVSKCGWTPYRGRVLKGWPVYTLLGEHVYRSTQGTLEGKRELEAYLLSSRGGVFAKSS